jgi:leader peptidase (prepilin peptidase) / N-methyltransferase
MTEYLELLQGQYPVLIMALALMFGLIIGSFLNVVILRLPVMLDREWTQQAREILSQPPGEEDTTTFNLVYPNSHCPGCKTEIKPWQNVPVISYLLLKGRCANCGIGIPARYPIVELVTGLLTVVVVATLGLGIVGFFGCLLTWVLICLSVIDYDTQLLPDDITLPVLWLGLVVNFFGILTPFNDAFIGACFGYLSLWSVYKVFKLVTGKEGMGYGDFKLLALLGAWLGWQSLPLVIILSSFAGVIIVGLLIATGREKSKPVPFGPYLAIAGWITLLWGDAIITWYLATFAS